MSTRAGRPRHAGRREIAPPARHAFWKVTWIGLGLVVLTAVVFHDVRTFEFVALDDPAYVTANPHVTAGLTRANVAWAFTATHAANWHPLAWLSHMLDVELFGLNAGAHHLVSLFLHTVNTLLLLLLLVRMTGGAVGRSAFVAALFAIHPLHVESVAWVAERKDVLSTLCGMLALLSYVEYARAGGPSDPPRSPRVRAAWYAGALLFLALGLMAKPMLVTLPFVMLLLDAWPLARFGRATGRRLVLEKMPFFALVAASSVVTLLVQRQGGAMTAFQKYPFALLLENALGSYATYMANAAWPAGLAMFYPMPASIPAWKVAVAAVVIGVACVAAIRSVRTRRYVTVGWLWYLVTLVPVIGLVQVGLQARADRYTYVPLIGLFIIVAWGVPELTARWRFARAALPLAAVTVLLALAGTAHAQVQYWHDSTVLWARAIDATRGVENARSHFNAGTQLSEQGRLDEAIAEFRNAVRLDPEFADAHHQLGLALAAQGRVAESIQPLTEAVRLQPESAGAHSDLGVAFMQGGRVPDAIKHLSRAAELRPDLVELRVNLASALVMAGRTGDAIREFREVLRLDPANDEARRALASLTGPGS